MKHFSYGLDRLFHKHSRAFLVAREPEHLEGVHGTGCLEIAGTDADEAVGVAGGLEDPPCRFDVSPVEQFVALPVQLGLLVARYSLPWGIGGLDEAFSGESIEYLFIHTLPYS